MSTNNQFYEHPHLEFTSTVLGSGQLHTKTAETAVDVLLCPPPESADVVRVLSGVFLLNTSGADIVAAVAPDVNFALVLKTATGEAVLPFGSESNGLVDGDSLQIQPDIQTLLRPTDRGIYLRIVALGVTNFTAFGLFNDVRRIDRATLDMTDVVQTALSGKVNTVRKIARGGEEFEHPFLTAVNTDSVDHDVLVFLYDGTTQIPIAAAVTVPAGSSEELFSDGLVPFLLEGWQLRVQLGEPITDDACVLYVGYTDVNLYPVRQDQGGAY